MRMPIAWLVVVGCAAAPAKPVTTPAPAPVAAPEPTADVTAEPAVRPAREPDPDDDPDRAGPHGRAEPALTPDLVLAKIQSVYLAGVKRCYQLEPPAAAGNGCMKLDLEVQPDGSVHGTVTASTPTMRRCVEARIAGWRFPAPGQLAAFTIPLNCGD